MLEWFPHFRKFQISPGLGGDLTAGLLILVLTLGYDYSGKNIVSYFENGQVPKLGTVRS